MFHRTIFFASIFVFAACAEGNEIPTGSGGSGAGAGPSSGGGEEGGGGSGFGGMPSSGGAPSTGGNGNGGNGNGATGGEGTGGAPPTCADANCDVNATCDDSTGTPVCTCNSGYTGNGQTCTPVSTDECQVANGGCATGCTCSDTMTAPPVCTCKITQSSSQSIVAANSVSCNNGFENDENSYYRAFDLNAFGITGAFAISSVEIATESASAPAGSQAATVRLHRLNGAMNTANFTQLASSAITIPNISSTIQTYSIAATAVAGSTFVVELLTPAQPEFSDILYFIGSNTSGETAPSYLRAPGCGFSQPTMASALGIAGLTMHIVMNVNGTYTP